MFIPEVRRVGLTGCEFNLSGMCFENISCEMFEDLLLASVSTVHVQVLANA